MRKPCDDLIRCKKCWEIMTSYLLDICTGEYITRFKYRCEFRDEESFYDTPCTTQDYMICPLNGQNPSKKEGC